MNLELTHIPIRDVKPRTNGITVIEDSQYSLHALEQLLSTASHVIDYARITPQVLLSQQSLRERILLYKKHTVIPFISGLLFEAMYLRNSIPEYIQFLKQHDITCIEISDGTIEIKPKVKAQIIKGFSANFKVISKVGPAKKDYIFNSDNWRQYIESSLEAGATKIMIEGSEAGASQSINGVLEINDILVHGISKYAPIETIIWEASQISQQLWLISQFGNNVNIAHILPNQVLDLESLRLGLSIHTLVQNLPPHLTVGNIREFDTIYNFDWQI